MKNKWIALLLAAALGFTALVGCTGENEKEEPDHPVSSSSSSAEESVPETPVPGGESSTPVPGNPVVWTKRGIFPQAGDFCVFWRRNAEPAVGSPDFPVNGGAAG